MGYEPYFFGLEVEWVLKPHRALAIGTLAVILLLQVRSGYPTVVPNMPPIPVIPAGFVALTGPRGITVLIGPLEASPYQGYERMVIVPGQPAFWVSTEPGVTPQEIADTYG